MMLRRQNSPTHRNEGLLCDDLSRRTQCVNRRSLGYPPSSQPPEPRSVGERDRFHTIPTFMAPMVAPEGNFPMYHHHIEPMATGYYPAPFPMYTPVLPQFSDHYPVDGGFISDAYDRFLPTYQSLDTPTDGGGIFSEPYATHQPPIPPAAPEQSIPLNLAFYYHPCRWLSGPRCDGLAPGRNREMGEHLRVSHHFIGHERDTVQCEWENCGQIMQRMNVPRHIVSRHLLAAAHCRFCSKQFSRPDVVARHERTCNVVSPVSSSF